MSKKYKKIIKNGSGDFELNINQGISLREIDLDDDGKMSHVVLDVVNGYLPYKDIPVVVEYLNTVYKARVKKGTDADISCAT